MWLKTVPWRGLYGREKILRWLLFVYIQRGLEAGIHGNLVTSD